MSRGRTSLYRRPEPCKDIDERVTGFLTRPLAGEWPYLWLDATYPKVRAAGRIVSVAAIIAVAVNIEGRREIVGLHIGPSEAEVFWSDFLKSLEGRGLTGIKLVISDAHDGLKAAIVRVLGATWQRCRVHWTRNALAYVPKGQHTMVAAALRQAFQQPDDAAARTALLHVAEMMRARWPKLAAFIIDSEADVLAYTTFPSQHRTKLHSTNSWNDLIKRSSGGPMWWASSPTRTRSCGSSAPSSSRPTTTGSSSTVTCRSKAWPVSGSKRNGRSEQCQIFLIAG
jgi:putative transposase